MEHLDQDCITAEAYHSASGTTFVKIKFQGLGLYLNSFTVRESPKYPDKGLWVQAPKYQVNGSWKEPIEFNKNSGLWKLIEAKCRESAELYQREVITDGLEDFDMSAELNKVFSGESST